MEAKLLSECGKEYVFPVEKDSGYRVEIEPGEYLVIEVGCDIGKSTAKFTHPNIALSVPKVYGFKHYRHGGSKFWTHRAGLSHYFVIPRSVVKLLPEKGYSYVPAEINGVRVSFNVTGGAGFDGPGIWTDWLKTHTQISVGHKLADLKRIAEVAVRGTSMEPIAVEPMNGVEDYGWKKMVAEKMIKAKILEAVKTGKAPVIYLNAGLDYSGMTNGKGIELHPWKKRAIILDMDCHRVSVKHNQIDWYRTAKVFGLDEFGRNIAA